MKISPIKIGNIEWRNNVILAPMSGVSDVPFRRAAWNCGAGMVISEMVASEALVSGQEEMRLKSESADLPVHVVQLAGRQAHWMALAAKMAEENGADIIDINMGCPARKVTNGLSGSALMRDPDHALSLIEAVIGAVKVPVTLKMRLGWDHNSITAPQLAKRAVEAGIQLITVHGRTRCQFYKGKADWQAVQEVRDQISVPLIINGDIKCGPSAKQAVALSNADGVMIGRASYGQPDLPGRLANLLLKEQTGGQQSSQYLRYDVCSHYGEMIEFYGAELGVRCARKHVGWWVDNLPIDVPAKFKVEMMTTGNPQKVLDCLEQLKCELSLNHQGSANDINQRAA